MTDVSNGIILEPDKDEYKLIEPIIFKLLFIDTELRSTMMPYLQGNILLNKISNKLLEIINQFEDEHGAFPNIKDLKLYNQDDEIKNYIDFIVTFDIKEYNKKYLLSSIEHYIRKCMFSNMIEELHENVASSTFRVDSRSDIPERMRDIFSFTFDKSVGMNLFSEEGIERMIDFFHQQSKYVPSYIKGLDMMMGGGFHAKSLSLILAPTNQGKSAIMGAFAANQIMNGKNILYITLEMSEEMISQRIMANIFDINMDGLKMTDKSTLIKKLDSIKDIVEGRFRVKEFPTSSTNSNSIIRLLKDYKTKQGFEPDEIIVDYLGLLKPNRARKVSAKHEDLQTVSEELRDIGITYDIPVVSAMQTTRDGFNSDNIDLDNISASFGVAMTADFVLAAIRTDELDAANQYRWVTVKNRFGQNNQEINVGMDFSKMKLHDLGEVPRNRNNGKIISNNSDSNDDSNTGSLLNTGLLGSFDEQPTLYDFE